MPFCYNCGNKLQDGDIFCYSCGTKVAMDDAPAAPAAPVTAPVVSFAAPAEPATTPAVSFTAPAAPAEPATTPAAPFAAPAAPATATNSLLTAAAATPVELPGAPVAAPDPVSSAKTTPQAAPTFTPPAPVPIPKTVPQPAPTFTPPSAPTFTPPAPTFTPPARHVHDGPVCYYHQDEPVVAKCARCNKYLCQDCFDSYGVSSGEYAGKALCYDCTKEIVAENVKILKKNKGSIIFTFVMTLVGMVILGIVGGSIGASVEESFRGIGIGAFVGAMIGGCFWTFIKGWFSRIGGAMAAGEGGLASFLIGFFLGFIIEAVISIYRTIRKIIECLVYLVRTSGFIKSDSAALQEMAEYMEYTQIRNQNKGVDIETLLSQNSQLANNSVAQMARTQSEEEIEARMRNCVASINENGEIIRNFSA